jgi:hypothetical protein
MIEARDFELVSVFAHEGCAKPPTRTNNYNFHPSAADKCRFIRRRSEAIASFQYRPVRSSNGCHQDGLSMYH